MQNLQRRTQGPLVILGKIRILLLSIYDQSMINLVGDCVAEEVGFTFEFNCCCRKFNVILQDLLLEPY